MSLVVLSLIVLGEKPPSFFGNASGRLMNCLIMLPAETSEVSLLWSWPRGMANIVGHLHLSRTMCSVSQKQSSQPEARSPVSLGIKKRNMFFFSLVACKHVCVPHMYLCARGGQRGCQTNWSSSYGELCGSTRGLGTKSFLHKRSRCS